MTFAGGGEMAIQAEGVGALGDAAEEGGFGEGEIFRGGVEVIACGGFKAGDFPTVGGVVEVGGEDFLLGVEALHFAGACGLEEFSPEGAFASG